MLYKEHAKCIRDSHIPRDHHQYIMFTHRNYIYVLHVCRKIGVQHGLTDNTKP